MSVLGVVSSLGLGQSIRHLSAPVLSFHFFGGKKNCLSNYLMFTAQDFIQKSYFATSVRFRLYEIDSTYILAYIVDQLSRV